MGLTKCSRSRANLTGLTGYLDASYQELVDAFGEPNSSGDKSQAEWVLWDSDLGSVVTIYDYKYDGMIELHRDWHVGGDERSLAAIRRVFPGVRSAY